MITPANRRMLVSCFLGTTIEWYDFLVYGFLAPLAFDQLFFPKLSPLSGTIAVFGVFAVGFAARADRRRPWGSCRRTTRSA
jgi:hypothetical protein